MSDRLAELLHQRALLQEHLAWLEGEIAAASDASVRPSTRPISVPAPPPSEAAISRPADRSVHPIAIPSSGARVAASLPSPVVVDLAEKAVPAADEILEQYRQSSGNVQQDVRKGCFLYFAAAFVVLGLVVTVLYFAISSR
jgi:hypothetical protein